MIVVVIIGLLATLAFPTFNRVRMASQDKAILNNARQLASASDQYMLEHGVSSVSYNELVGTTAYIRTIQLIAAETYPEVYTEGAPVIVTNIAGSRTLSFDR